MPRSFEVSFDSPASVQQIHAAFAEREYWLARLDFFGGAKTLDSLDVGADGAVTAVVSEDLRHGGLPAVLTAVYRGDLSIVTTEVWTPAGDGTVRAEVDVVVTGAPGAGRGAGQLIPAGTGSRLRLAASVRVKVPLLGGPVEAFIAREFADGLGEIQRFTTSWVGEHG